MNSKLQRLLSTIWKDGSRIPPFGLFGDRPGGKATAYMSLSVSF